MPEFQYTAREMTGKEVVGVLTAANEQEAINSLAGKSLFPTRLALAETERRQQRAVGKRIAPRHLSVLYSQLGDLLHSGVPLLRSLEVLEQQAIQPTIKAVLQDVREQVAEGSRLADALRRHPRAFNELTVSMIRAGEEGGFLEDVLKRIAQFTEHQEEMKSRVMGAMAYPVFLMVACVAIVIWLLIFLVPRFGPIFDRLREQGALPTPTAILLLASEFMQKFGLWLAAALVVGLAASQSYLRSDAGRLLIDTWRLRLKGLGPIVRSLAISRFCRILGTLLRNGVPILQSLRISKDATGNMVLAQAIGVAAENVSAGKSLARPLGASGHFPREVVEMITVGEEANNLEQVLINIADNMEHRTFRNLELFVRLLEPMMLLVMGGVIFFIMLALLLPVFQGADALA
jgi:general secretion pathway protein F/type IV pilus assembly protein PilC